ncbi:RIO1 family regulatory kinase/ATPase domain-containing protein [Halocalculus aciditolerans]|uniref:non-specific serine/threonine protein kinase n=1 Tax=Halocalculus aciditolerans TaxID=1383812 RepID=A0A830FC43_9EURY|nr:RIO1 family regulatory kinase/ATPase [Halocalculus aciditolerans]GGL59783.1 aminoglycoside phosphotransferase [Halocalculus aciditolerans]
MSVRRFVRGTVPWDQLDAVFAEFAERYDEPVVRVEFLDAENWFSTPCVVNEEWFVKVVTPQNAFVHSLFTGVRNLGVFTSGTEGFFEPYDDPVEMAAHELEATERMRELGVNAPEPVEVFSVDELGVLVMEYLPDFVALDDLGEEAIEAHLDALFAALATMHEHGLAHGDLRAENVLVVDDDLYFIDATKVNEGGITAARAYDLACALAVLEPLVGATTAVAAAAAHYAPDDLLEAREFLDFVAIRPDHDFDAAALKAELDTIT